MDYIDFILAGTAMPVLLGYRPACLICFHKKKSDMQVLEEQLRLTDQRFGSSHVHVYERADRHYIWIYRKKALEERIMEVQGHWILRWYGYEDAAGLDAEMVLARLKERLVDYYEGAGGFPHEIGLFLGYPLRDVEAYIMNEGKGGLCTGYWRVYYERAQAERVFRIHKELQRKGLAFVAAGHRICEYRL